MTKPIIMRARRIGIPIKTRESKAEKMIKPEKIIMLKRPVPVIGQKDFLI
ncbi:unnamed protein product [marine sediment metagenome]|uniref:Uncharacterized protein n=1 Tax=marine sediment metagenome TaxID=412755 RepID=X1W256_9ZZZZ